MPVNNCLWQTQTQTHKQKKTRSPDKRRELGGVEDVAVSETST